ncbi:universal stress protein [Haloechinothrix sp. LS1_15]|uniref:universal stress protein n=1 Tax=Haloechinothrix sp. LS1_15 TaxID=2652248 RepID=UPI002948614F|nr:universal stress protein [Haloechinothrix sp. LS1_15]MDV6014259.1 universal stress protein [Haloechinothrix sp. LS1_15]
MELGDHNRLPIVVGVDGSEQSLVATRWAAREARAREVPLLLVHAMGVPNMYMGVVPPSAEAVTALREDARTILEQAAQVATATAEVTVETALRSDTVAAALRAVSHRARMVVVGASGYGRFLAGVAMGATPVQVASHAACPVVVIRGQFADQLPETAPIVVGIDGSELSDEALGHAYEIAAHRAAPLIAVHAWSDQDTEILFSASRAHFDWELPSETEQRVLAERLAGWADKYPDVVVERVVVRDKPRHKLLELSSGAQLVVVGSRGRGGFAGLLLGSTSQALMHHAACPVMVVRPAATASA